MKKKVDKWSTEKGILEEIHRIREESYKERLRIGAAAWLKKINRPSPLSRALKVHKKAHADS